jgi:hypothetical protein
MMDCISIWQKDKDTISEALPDEYKDKSWVEKVIRLDKDEGPQNLTIQEKTVSQRDQNPAKSDSVGQIEDVSGDFDKMNRG